MCIIPKLLTDYGIGPGSRISLALLARSGPLKLSKAKASDASDSRRPNCYPEVAVAGPRARTSRQVSDGEGMGDLDLSFTAERRVAAKTRAEENLKTMAKMKELRQNLEKLKLEKKNRCGAGVDVGVGEGGSRGGVKRNSWSGAGGGARMRSPNSASVIAPALLSAPEDTSAKESSAGETEYEEWRPSGPVSLRDYFYRHTESSLDTDNERIGQLHHGGSPTSVLRRSVVPQQGFGAFQPYKGISATRGSLVRVVSSSSEPESSGALWTGSDFDDDILYTQDNDPLGIPSSVLSPKTFQEEGEERGGLEFQTHFYPPGDSETNNGERDTPSDPSELSSGMIICDLSNDFRRVKVKRKHHLPTKVGGGAGGGACGGALPRQFQTGAEWGGGRPPRRSQWRGQVWKNRPRSRPRQYLNPAVSPGGGKVPAPTSTSRMSTGESSSDADEKEGGWSSGGGTTGLAKLPGAAHGRAKFRSFPGPGGRNQAEVSVVRHHKLPQSSQSQVRCNTCGCKLSNILSTYQCRCGKTLCHRHRYQDAHVCSCDTK